MKRGDKKSQLTFTVKEATELLPFLMNAMHGISRNRAKALLVNRLVLVDNIITTNALTTLHPGQTVQLDRSKQKMAFQTILALAFSLYCYFHPQVGSVIKIPFLRAELDLGILYVPIMMFVIVGTTNSANLLDGLDGLCAGVSIVDFTTLAVLAGVAGFGGDLGVCCAALVGGLMGYWVYNVHPAKVFMGDTGSMFIGGAVVAAAMLLRQPLILVLIAFWMLMSTLSVMIQVTYFQKTGGKRIFKMSPIHHHFELCGMSEFRIVAMYMTTTVILCLITLLGVL